jgi:hypothetical protein
MNIDELIKAAQQKESRDREKMRQPAYVKTIAWFCYLGLIRHTDIKAQRCHVNLDEVFAAGALEPRILELLPAVLSLLPEAIEHRTPDIPRDLADVLEAIRQKKDYKNFRDIPVKSYLEWLDAPAG